MIRDVHETLSAWVRELLGPEVRVTFERPGSSVESPTVNLHLFELNEPSGGRIPTPQRLELKARFLVTTWAKDVAVEHELLEKLVFGAMARSDFELQVRPLAPSDWAALGIFPRPGLGVTVPLRFERPVQAAKKVAGGLEVRMGPLVTLEGRVVGPDELPIGAAMVVAVDSMVSATTDGQGRFKLPATPAVDGAIAISVRAKGMTRRLRVPVSEGEITIRFDVMEG